jgi:hypothetical protein
MQMLPMKNSVIDMDTPKNVAVGMWQRSEGDGGGLLQVYCIFLFLCAASLFGTLISQVNEIVNQKTSVSKDLDEILESYLVVEPRLLNRSRVL